MKPRVVLAALALSVVLAAPAAAQAPERVVAFTPFTANVLVDLGVTPVAVGDAPAGEVDPRLDHVPRLKLAHPNGPNLEQLLALRPDVVFSSPVWRPGTPRIQRLGIEVYDGYDPQRLSTIGLNVGYIAEKVGRAAQGRALAARLNREIRRASKLKSNAEWKCDAARRGPRVLLVMGLARYTMAILGKSWGADVICAAGGRMVTNDIQPIGRTGEGTVVGNLSNEKVVQLNPDIIVVVPHGNANEVAKIAAYYRSFRPWRTTKAAKKGRIYVPTDDNLLQASSDPAAVIREVRRDILKRRR